MKNKTQTCTLSNATRNNPAASMNKTLLPNVRKVVIASAPMNAR